MKKLLKDCLYIFFVVVVLFFITGQPSLSNNLKFVQLSDIHFTSVRGDTTYKLLSQTGPLLEDAVKQINGEKGVDFVVITGDVIDQSTELSLFQVTDILNQMKYPWYYVIGNHDTYNGELTKKRLIEIVKEKNKNFKYDSLYYTFKPKKGFRVIVLDGAKEKRTSRGFIPQEELNWLDEILSKSKKDTVLIFIHFPVVEPFSSENHRIDNADEFYSVIKKYKMPMALFSGHYHATKITKRGNIIHVSTPSLASYPHAFRVVDVQNKYKKVIFKFDFKETNLKDLQNKTKIMMLGGARYYGRPSDRDAVIVIDKKK